MTTTYQIDAKGQSVGRLASKIAALLNGKSSLDFAKNKVLDIKVEVTNVNDIQITGNKLEDSLHKRYSGYPGGLIERNWKKVISRKGMKEILVHAVNGMLPKNKLQEKRLRNLIIKD